MKIAIVGAGAMGSLYGALLKEAGAEVRLLDIWQAHVDAINERGLTVEYEGQSRTVNISATAHGETIGQVDLAIIFVKSTATEAAAQTTAALVGKTGMALTLQNGLGNAEIIAGHIDAGRILAGTTAQGATLLGPGAIRHAGVGVTRIGLWSGNAPETAGPVADLFNAAGIETELMDDIRPLIWNKLLVNVGINAITALTGIKNGEIPDLDASRDLCRMAVEEAVALARALGIRVMDNAVAHVFDVARATAANRSSMGQDVDHQRLTEIGMINGKVVQLAKEKGIPTPINFALSALVETLQRHYRQ